MILNNQLKEIRKQKGLTQQALAEQVGVTRQSIIAIEKRKFVPSVKLSLRIASALGIPLETLFWLEEEEETEK